MAPPIAIGVEGLTDTQAITLPDLLAVDNIANRRAQAGKLVAGVAALFHSDHFKSPDTTKPRAKRWDHLISEQSKARQASNLKNAAQYLSRPDMISLGGGLPCPEYFPFQEVDLKVPSVPNFSERQTRESGMTLKIGKYDAAEGHGIFDLSIALNYGQGVGAAQLLRFVTEHTEIVCNPPYADWRCSLSVGNTSAIHHALSMLSEHGDYVLAEEYTYSSFIETTFPYGLKVLGIKVDSEGLLPEAMDEVLSSWDISARGARKPHLLYTVPTGQNPTGATQSLERRKAIYAVAQKHDVFIIEDEPYYFLQMQPYTGAAPDVPPPASIGEFLKTLVPTFLSLDIDGRVIRLDSFSKVIAPGTRVGWITASEQIVERFIRHNEVSSQGPSGFSQIILYKLLDEAWGHEGYLKWLMDLRLRYTGRRDTILNACEKYLPKAVVRWDPPSAGMFLWLEILWQHHPRAATTSLAAIEQEIFHANVDHAVLLACGSWFRAEREAPTTAAAASNKNERMFFRATFAAAAEERMTEAIERFGVALRQVFGVAE